MAVVGLDLGGTKIAAAAFSSQGDLLSRRVERVEGRRGPEVGALAVDLARKTIDEIAEPVSGVGMCVPGIYYPDTGRVWAPNIPGWDDYPLREELGAAFEPHTSVRIESDRSCYILGEIWKGAARGCRDAVFLAVGTGIGAGIVSGGRIINGKHGVAGAIGWMGLDRPHRRGYETFGCFEYAASGDGLVRAAGELMPGDYAGPLRSDKPISAKDVFAAYGRGDDLARRVLENAVQLWGMAVANLVSLLNPEKIIFGGGVFGPGVQLLDAVHAEAEKWAQPISMSHVKLEAAVLGSDAGLYGAARLALDVPGRDDISQTGHQAGHS